MSVLAQFLKKITLQENANGIGKVFWAQIKIVTRYVFLYILTFDADFSTKTAEPGNWGLKRLLRDTLQHKSSFVKRFVYLAGMYHCV